MTRKPIIKLAKLIREQKTIEARAVLDEYKGSYAVRLFLEAVARNVRLGKDSWKNATHSARFDNRI